MADSFDFDLNYINGIFKKLIIPLRSSQSSNVGNHFHDIHPFEEGLGCTVVLEHELNFAKVRDLCFLYLFFQLISQFLQLLL